MNGRKCNNFLTKIEAYMLTISKKHPSESQSVFKEIDSTAVPTGDYVYCPEIYEARLPKSEHKEPQVRIKKSRLAQRSNAAEEDYQSRSSATLHR